MQFGLFLASHDVGDLKSPTQIYDETIEQAVVAEQLGYDYVWIPEHDLVRYIVISDVLQLVIAIACRTERIRIGSAVFVTSGYHPLALAADMTQADHLTRGRFEPGLGRGGSFFELRQLQAYLPEEDSRERFAEFVDIVRRAWTEEHAIQHQGKYFQFDNAYVVPRPYSAPHPRLWLASTTPESTTWAALQGLDVLHSPFRRPFSYVEEVYRAFRAGGAPKQGTHGPTTIAINRTGYVGDTMEDARKILPLVHHHDCVVAAARIDAEYVVDGVRMWKPGLQVGTSEQEHLEHLLIGDPQTVLEKVMQYEELGIDQLIFYTSLGQDQRMVLRSMELFAKHVIPAVKQRRQSRSTTTRA